MKQRHRFLSILLTLCLVLTMLPVGSLPVLAAGGELEGEGTEESPYQIADAEDLWAFADLVNRYGSRAWVELTADIDLNPGYTFHEDGTYTYSGEGQAPGVQSWTPIGTIEGRDFQGTFEGNGHTISGIYMTPVAFRGYYGLFGIARNGTIKNVGVVNSYIRGENHTGGVLGYGGEYEGEGTTISNCYNTGTVIGTSHHIGGVVGILSHSSIENCYNTGTVTGNGTDSRFIGGVIGALSDGSITNCYNTGAVTGSGADSCYIGGVIGDLSDGSITNCYNTGAVTGSGANSRYIGGVAGSVTLNGSAIKNCYNTGVVTGNQYIGGVVGYFAYSDIENCYYLNTSASSGIGHSNDSTAEAKIQVKTATEMKSAEFAAALNAGQNPAPFMADFDTLGGYFNGGNPIFTWQNPFPGGSGVENDPFLISKKEELEAFRDYVNTGCVSICGTLIGDIDLNPGITFNADGTYTEGTTPEQWTPIGDNSHGYTGTFNGDGHTVSGVYINNTSASRQGLFGYLSSGSIQNLGVVNSYIQASDYAGGIVGRTYGDSSDHAKISNCFSTAKVIGASSWSYAGGITSHAEYADIENCYNTGAVTSDYRAGGIAGYLNNGTAALCYNTGDIGFATYPGSVLGIVDSEGTVHDCYFLEDTGYAGIVGCLGEKDNIVELSAAQMTGSAVWENMSSLELYYVWRVGESTTTWEYLGENQDNTGSYGLMAKLPQLKVFADTGKAHEEILVQTTIGLQQEFDSDGKTYYLIHNKEELETFRNIVNNTLTEAEAHLYTANAAANGRLKADIDLNPGYTFAADGTYTYSGEGEAPDVQSWTPIGSSSRQYTGTFDGGGYAVSGMYINTDSSCQGLFGYVGSGGMVQSLGIANSYIRMDSYGGSVAGRNEGIIQNCENSGFVYGYYAGGIAGQNGGEITGCLNTGTIDGTGYNGGIAGYNNGGSISGSYNTASVSGTSTVGGITGSNSGTNAEVENCYNTGSVTATGAGTTSQYAGGIVGRNSATISSSYNVGTVSGQSNSGGVAGYAAGRSGIVQNCYYLDTCGQSGMGTSLTAEEMTGSDALGEGNMSALDSAVWTVGEDEAWKYLGDNEDNTGNYSLTGRLPQLTVFVDNGHEEILVQTITGLQQETVNGEMYYRIYDAGQLKTFRNIVNNTDLSEDEKKIYGENGNAAANGKLMADIDLNPGITFNADGTYTENATPEQWTPIGSRSRPYTGTFDGNSKTISGVYINNTTVTRQGLFGYVNGGSIQNLGVINSYIAAGSYSGSVVGQLRDGAAENCYNTGTVAANGEYIGGIAGYVNGSTLINCYNTGSVTGNEDIGGVAGIVHETQTLGNPGRIENCYNIGSITGDYSVGGVAGEIYTGGTVINCYNTGSVSGISRTGGVAGSNYDTVTNCYYLDTSAVAGTGNGSGEVTPLTTTQMTGSDALSADNMNLGTTAWTAGDDNTAWEYLGDNEDNTGNYGQMAKLPQLTVFAANGHEEIPLKIVTGLQQETINGEMYYRIYDAGQLKIFRNIVNGDDLTEDEENIYGEEGNAAVNGKLMADIDLNPGITFNADGTYTEDTTPEQWTPIGESSSSYAGTFDGNSKTISGVYINTYLHSKGLFGWVGNATVHNLGVVNSYIRASDWVGGIMGRVKGSSVSQAKITNCFSDATVIGTANSSYAGGIIGDAEYIDIENCYNTGTITGGGSTGGVVARIIDGSIRNCYNTGTVSVGSDVGGVVGEVTSSTVTNCYYLDTSASAGIDDGDGEATSLTIAQIEDAGNDGLLAKLVSGIPADQENPWNTQLSAMSAWEYGKPAVQPVFTWQTVVANAPTYTVTIPATATVNAQQPSTISANVGALRVDQTVEVTVDKSNTLTLTNNGGTNTVSYQLFVDDSTIAVGVGGTVLSTGNTSQPKQVSIHFTCGTTTYAGDYTGTCTFAVSVKESASE